jgi:hypothetical protein
MEMDVKSDGGGGGEVVARDGGSDDGGGARVVLAVARRCDVGRWISDSGGDGTEVRVQGLE